MHCYLISNYHAYSGSYLIKEKLEWMDNAFLMSDYRLTHAMTANYIAQCSKQ